MIERYTAVVSAGAVGLPITAFVRLTLLSHTSAIVDEIEQRLRAIPEVVEAYLLAGDDDYLVKIVIASFEAYEDLLRREIRAIPSLASIKTTFAFAVTKPQSPLPMPLH
ncbi:Lrp/AsnC family transcriptional regulator [Actinoplanes couchii]|uniref:Lrp/AsnC family transcriptional regulator n=1 Tax=Actinoplanes couchii TaxID=403638 RepID=UPI001EF2F0F6|nr:Lrp/AsnC family transcriptional regulator [Actinoplanes couchii]MDR6319332.1 DNA-binding Lrp family transcriptional regulator [Actinoplanes couchii]